MSERVLDILLGVQNRKLRQDLRNAKRDVAGFAKETSGRIRSSFRDAFGAVAGVGSVAGLAAVGKNVLDVDKKLTRLGIQAGQSKAEMMAFHDQLRDMSDDTGVSTESLADAAAQFVSLTGKYKQAREGSVVFAKTAAASGAALEDVAGAAASLKNNLGIDSVAGFNKGLSILLTQGKEGAVELKELAGLLPTIAPSFTKFGKSGTEGLAELGAALQVVRGGFGSGSQAATGLNALMSSLARNADKFKGVEMFVEDPKTGVKQFRQFSDIIRDIGNSKLARDPKALLDAFGSTEAERAFQELRKNQKQFAALFEKGLASNAVDEDFARYMESNAGRIEKAWQRLQNTLAREVTPERIEAITQALEGLGRAVAFVVDNIRLFVAIFATLKLAQWTARLHGLVTAMDKLGDSTDKARRADEGLGTEGARGAGKFGKALKGLAVVEAAALGYELGTALDKVVGLSDALAGVHASESNVQFAKRIRSEVEQSEKALDDLLAGRVDKALLTWGHKGDSKKVKAAAGRVSAGEGSEEDRALVEKAVRETGLFRGETFSVGTDAVKQRSVAKHIERREMDRRARGEIEKLEERGVVFDHGLTDKERTAGGDIIGAVKRRSGRDLLRALGRSVAASGERMNREGQVFEAHAMSVTGKDASDPETRELQRAMLRVLQDIHREVRADPVKTYNAVLDSSGRAPAP